MPRVVRRRVVIRAATAAALSILAGCSGGGSGACVERGGRATFFFAATGRIPIRSILSVRARSSRRRILRDLCEGLTTLAKDASTAPGVAKDWSVSADGKTYTFALRRGSEAGRTATRSSRTDFVAGLRRLVDPATASQYAQIIDVVVNAGDIINGKQTPEALGVSAPDDYSVCVS